VHTMSYLEMFMFLFHEYRLSLTQYWEQYPLDRGVTLSAAKALGIRHPKYPKTDVPVVMTLDAVATHLGPDGRPKLSAWDAKPKRLLENRRVQEKLSLHRAYCAHRGISHNIFTESVMPRSFFHNLMWMRGCEPQEGELVPADLLEAHRDSMLEDLRKRRPDSAIGTYCHEYDHTFGLERGTAMRVFGILLWRHDVKADLTAGDLMETKVQFPRSPFVPLDVRKAA
jgi:hypothetical protein